MMILIVFVIIIKKTIRPVLQWQFSLICPEFLLSLTSQSCLYPSHSREASNNQLLRKEGLMKLLPEYKLGYIALGVIFEVDSTRTSLNLNPLRFSII